MWRFRLITILCLSIIPAWAFAQEGAVNGQGAEAGIDCSHEQFEKAEKAFRERQLRIPPEKLLMSLVSGCPGAPWISGASNELTIVQDEHADSSVRIADYYQQKYEKGESTSNLGAITRYREVIEKYPRYSRIDHAMLILGNAYLSSGRLDDAFAIYTQLINQFPTSEYVKTAYKQLDVLAKKSIDSPSVK